MPPRKRVALTLVPSEAPPVIDLADGGTALKAELQTKGFAVIKIFDATDPRIATLRNQVYALAGSDPIRSGILGVQGTNPVRDAFMAMGEHARVRRAFEIAHGPGVATLLPSNDSLIYWSAGQTITDELGPLHIDKPKGSSETTYQGMLLLTDQSAATGGLAFGAPSGSKRRLNDGMMVTEGKSKVVAASAGNFIIWNSATWHHGKPPGTGRTKTRAALLLAYNPASQFANDVNKHIRSASRKRPFSTHSGWDVEPVAKTAASFADLCASK